MGAGVYRYELAKYSFLYLGRSYFLCLIEGVWVHLYVFLAMFTKGNNFHDLLFVPYKTSFQNEVHTLKGDIQKPPAKD